MLEPMDYVQIQNVLNFYPYLVDVPANYGRVGDVFTDDAVFDAGALGRYEGIEAMTEYWSYSPVRAVALEKTKTLAHNVVNIVITEDENGVVRCLSRCLGVSTDGVASVMVYNDVMRKTDRGWRIAERRLSPMNPPHILERKE